MFWRTMININPLQAKCFQLFITLFTLLVSFTTLVCSQTQPEFTLTQKISLSCDDNSPSSTVFEFQSSYFKQGKSTINDTERFELQNDNQTDQLVRVKLRKTIDGSDGFTFAINLDSNHKLIISGTLSECFGSANHSKCTVIIAFLASLCLILFTALALSLIILRRKKPITFKFGQKEDNKEDYDNKEFSDNYEESYVNKNPSIDITNNIRNQSIDSPRGLQPRKSSLKPPKLSLTEHFNNNNFTSHENGAFNGTELEVVDEISEEKPEEKPEVKNNIQESRRKSIVTFSDKTEVNYG